MQFRLNPATGNADMVNITFSLFACLMHRNWQALSCCWDGRAVLHNSNLCCRVTRVGGYLSL